MHMHTFVQLSFLFPCPPMDKGHLVAIVESSLCHQLGNGIVSEPPISFA